MSDWKLLKQVVHASNNENHEALAALIVSGEIDQYPRCQAAAMLGFELTKENIKKHINAAKKLASFTPHDSWGFTEDYRHALLTELLADMANPTPSSN